jgi:hypothetical protein
MPRRTIWTYVAIGVSALAVGTAVWVASVARRGNHSLDVVASAGLPTGGNEPGSTDKPLPPSGEPRSRHARAAAARGGTTEAARSAPPRPEDGHPLTARDFATLRSYEGGAAHGLTAAADALRGSLETMRTENQPPEAMDAVSRRIGELDAQSAQHAARERQYAALASAKQ